MIVGPLTANQPVVALSTRGWARVFIQILGVGQMRIGASRAELLSNPDGTQFDGITITQNNGIFVEWWKGQLWVAFNGAGQRAVIVVPGQEVISYGT